MHERSIAQSIIETITAAATRDGARNVGVVRLRIGALTAVSPESLAFHFSEAGRDTLLAGSRLEIESVPIVLQCMACGAETEPDDDLRFRCARCGQPTGNVIRGRELEIVSFEVT